MAQWVENLPSKCKILATPSMAEKEEEKTCLLMNNSVLQKKFISSNAVKYKIENKGSCDRNKLSACLREVAKSTGVKIPSPSFIIGCSRKSNKNILYKRN
jgi:hypothetical protein